MKADQIPPEPYPGDSATDHDSWKVTLRYQGRRMTLKFHTGLGHRVNRQPVTPSIGTVLSSLYSDASTAESCRDVEDFMSDFGYKDMKAATRVFAAVRHQAEQLKTLFGDDYDVFTQPPDDGDWSEFEGSSLELPPSEDEDEDEDETYMIKRFRFNGGSEVIKTGLTLDEAQEHCNRDDTSGDGWFDGFEKES